MQLKNTAPYKEGIKFLDELQCDISHTKEKSVAIQTNNEKLQQNDDIKNVALPYLADSCKEWDVVDGENEYMGQKETIFNETEVEIAPLSTATAILADVVVNETRKIIKITGDQIKKSAKYKESIKLFDELNDDYEQQIGLRNTKLKVLTKAHIILSYAEKDYRSKNLPELFIEFISGLLSIRENFMFFESNVSLEELAIFRRTITFSFEESIFSNCFIGNHYKKASLSPVISGNSLLEIKEPIIYNLSAATSCISKKYHKEKPYNANNSGCLLYTSPSPRDS